METYVQLINHEQAETHMNWSGWCVNSLREARVPAHFFFISRWHSKLPSHLWNQSSSPKYLLLAKNWLSSTKQTVQAADTNNIKIHELKLY